MDSFNTLGNSICSSTKQSCRLILKWFHC